jgi:cytochrome c-type biogenesis protein CcmH
MATQAYTLEEFEFQSPAQEAEFKDLIEELRCLVCQNESLAASQAELAQDLREEVYKMMLDGQSRDQIVDFLVERYGDFVLYNPPLKPSNYPLWFGPLILVVIASFFLFRTLLRKKGAREAELSDQDQARLQKILAESTDGREKDK